VTDLSGSGSRALVVPSWNDRAGQSNARLSYKGNLESKKKNSMNISVKSRGNISFPPGGGISAEVIGGFTFQLRVG
jgi:hypothetical protein